MTGLDDWSSQIETRQNQLIQLRAISGLEIRYRWDDTTDIGVEVGTGDVKGDNANLALATQFALSRIDDFGRLALDAQLDFGIPGFFEVNDLSRDTVFEYSITTQTQRDSDVVLDVVFIDETAGGPPQANDLVQAQIWPQVIFPPL